MAVQIRGLNQPAIEQVDYQSRTKEVQGFLDSVQINPSERTVSAQLKNPEDETMEALLLLSTKPEIPNVEALSAQRFETKLLNALNSVPELQPIAQEITQNNELLKLTRNALLKA